MSDETEGEVLPCIDGPWDGTTYLLSPGMVAVRVFASEEGCDMVHHADDILGHYEREGRTLVWQPREAPTVARDPSGP